jgi:L-asparagine transporter-like permease
MRRDFRQGKNVFNVVTTCVQSNLLCYFCDIYTYKWPTFDKERLGKERTSLMLLQPVSSPICNVIFVIFTHTSGPRLMRRDCRQGKEVFNVVTTCVQSHLLCYFVIFTHTSDPRLMRRDFRQGKNVFNVVTTCVQSNLLCYFCDIYTYKWPTFDKERLGRERTSLMLLQPVSSPICNVIFVIFTHSSDSRLMRRDYRQTSGKDVFNVVTTCVKSHL